MQEEVLPTDHNINITVIYEKICSNDYLQQMWDDNNRSDADKPNAKFSEWVSTCHNDLPKAMAIQQFYSTNTKLSRKNAIKSIAPFPFGIANLTTYRRCDLFEEKEQQAGQI